MDEHVNTQKREKKKRQRHNCCVPQCSELKNPENHFHRVPRDSARRKEWAIAIKTAKKLTDGMRVCSKHFKAEDYIPTRGAGLKPNLKQIAVPSQNLPVRKNDKVISSPVKCKNDARSDRSKKRASWSNDKKEASENEEQSSSCGNFLFCPC